MLKEDWRLQSHKSCVTQNEQIPPLFLPIDLWDNDSELAHTSMGRLLCRAGSCRRKVWVRSPQQKLTRWRKKKKDQKSGASMGWLSPILLIPETELENKVSLPLNDTRSMRKSKPSSNRTSLVVRGLRLHAPSTAGPASRCMPWLNQYRNRELRQPNEGMH